jgi:hypothetical protein
MARFLNSSDGTEENHSSTNIRMSLSVRIGWEEQATYMKDEKSV